MSALSEIESAAKLYQQSRDIVANRLHQLNQQIEDIKAKALPLLRSGIHAAKAAETELLALIESNPETFIKPKTLILHGIKVGFEKEKGSIEWEDEAQTVFLIKKHLPEQFETLVKTTCKPLKTPIAQLPAAMLKKIGATVVNSSDKAIARPIDKDLDRMLDTLLKADPSE